MKHCYSAVSLLYLLNQEKITAEFAEVKIHLLLRKCKKNTANLRICGYGPPIAILRNLQSRNREYKICSAQHCKKCVPYFLAKSEA